VARTSVEAEYRVITLVTCELVCLKKLLKELQFGDVSQMTFICDNQATSDKLIDIFIKSLHEPIIDYICNKFDKY